MTKPTNDTDLQNAASAGALAFLEGLGQDDCPHTTGTEAAQAWLAGWRGAAEEEGL